MHMEFQEDQLNIEAAHFKKRVTFLCPYEKGNLDAETNSHTGGRPHEDWVCAAAREKSTRS